MLGQWGRVGVGVGWFDMFFVMRKTRESHCSKAQMAILDAFLCSLFVQCLSLFPLIFCLC